MHAASHLIGSLRRVRAGEPPRTGGGSLLAESVVPSTASRSPSPKLRAREEITAARDPHFTSAPVSESGESRSINRQAGFTLIEVLVALTILSISLAVLLAIFMQGLDRARESDNEAQARVLAQSLLAQAKSAANPSMGTSAGKSDNFLWRLQILPYGTAQDRAAWQDDAAQIVATVSWRGDGGLRSISLSTLRLLPKPESGSG